MVQWLALGALTARGLGSIPGWGSKIPQATYHGQKTKMKTNKQKDPNSEVPFHTHHITENVKVLEHQLLVKTGRNQNSSFILLAGM